MAFPQILSKQAFWDTDMHTLDAEKHAAFIVERVLEHGTWSDIKAIARYYGLPKLKETAINAKFFLPDTVSFLSIVFQLNKEEMACYTSRPYRRNVLS
jgi:hypothetical protein